MTAHWCPKCQTKQLFWYIDEDESPLTQWNCGHCHYVCEEDEQKMTLCPACGKDKYYCWMIDEDRTYWYCFHCGRNIDTHEETFNMTFRAKIRYFLKKLSFKSNKVL